MAGTPTVYVICDQNCKWEGMTKEQIIAAIAEATGNTPTAIDAAFITKIKEMNAGGNIKFWTGTQAQFNALTTTDAETLYIITDDDSADSWDEIAEELENIKNGKTVVERATHAQYASTDHTKGTIEERLTALGFNQGSVQAAVLSNVTQNAIYKQGNFVYGRFAGALTTRIWEVGLYGEDIAFTIPEGYRISALAKTRLGNDGYFPCNLSFFNSDDEIITTSQGGCKFNEDGTVQLVDWDKNSFNGILKRIWSVDVIFGYQID